MEGRERGHRLGGEGPLAGRGGWVDFLQGGIVGGLWGPWGEWWGLRGELWGLWMSHDVTGHAGRIAVGGCRRVWPIGWQPSKRGRGV